jgi:hypothetical protein
MRTITVRRGGLLAVALSVLAALLPAWGLAQSQAAATTRTTCSAADYHDDARLGPERLPNAGPLATVLKGYHRLAEMTSKAYLHAYYDTAGKTWRYPPQGGYLLTPDDQPVKFPVTLAPGQRIDRFGSEFGGYLSPEGTPYADRGIPPQSLDNTTTPDTCNYSRYKVVQPIPVQSGPIAPALGQPGFGVQYVLDASIFPSAPATGFNVGYLVANGYLARVNDPPETSYGG